MDYEQKQQLIEYLSQFMTPSKWSTMQRAIAGRTRKVTVVLEDIFQSHNLSAALRSIEGFGIQDVSLVSQHYKAEITPSVAKGSAQWLTLNRYCDVYPKATEQCFNTLRQQGYWIVATSPHAESHNLHTLPIDKKIALVFGTEETGISDYAKENADALVKIPMYGFTESFNISVSVAICLYDVTTRLRESNDLWHLSLHEQQVVLLDWLKQTVRGADVIERGWDSK